MAHRCVIVFCLPVLLLTGAVSRAAEMSTTAFNLTEHAREGMELTDAQATVLEEALVRSPDNVEARIRLLAYYQRSTRTGAGSGSPRAGHLLWLIEHYPDLDYDSVSYLLHLTPWIDDREIPGIRQAWERNLREKPDDLRRMAAAAATLEYADPPFTKALLVRGEQLDAANPHWPRQLGRMAERGISVNSKTGMIDAAAARDAFAAYERALRRLDARKGEWDLRALRMSLCKTAVDAGQLDAARQYGTLLVDEAKLPVKHAYQKSGVFEARNVGHTALGRVALRQGDMKAARRHLLESAVGEGAPVLSSFGPNMRFAREMLEKGERKTVLEFFNRCRSFWKLGGEKLDDWTIYVKGGGIPDFGANLSF